MTSNSTKLDCIMHFSHYDGGRSAQTHHCGTYAGPTCSSTYGPRRCSTNRKLCGKNRGLTPASATISCGTYYLMDYRSISENLMVAAKGRKNERNIFRYKQFLDCFYCANLCPSIQFCVSSSPFLESPNDIGLVFA